MNEKLRNSVHSINAKINSLTQRMEALKTQNSALSDEIQALKGQLIEYSQNESEFKKTLDKLNNDLNLANKQIIEFSQGPTGRSVEEIDELVKEIDYCIEQLKK
ncbi:MAG: hypothetical protein ACKO6A_05385 [Bacteroidota bacterium]